MPQWATFAGFAIVVTAGLLLLSHASRGVVEDADGTAESPSPTEETVLLPKSGVELRVRDSPENGTDERGPHSERDEADPHSEHTDQRSGVDADPPSENRHPAVASDRSQSTPTRSPADLSTGALLANVAVSQGLFGLLLLAGAWYAEIPARAFGVARDALTLETVLTGIALGVALYVANEAGATVGARFGLGDGERLRSALAPDSRSGWAVLLFVVLPVIAAFEELLFRGALIGVFAAGYGVSPWLLALGSSAAFGVGHGAQGRIGVLVTGALGFVLAAAFVLTGSLLVVVIAHYLVNALEFVVHEGVGFEWVIDGDDR